MTQTQSQPGRGTFRKKRTLPTPPRFCAPRHPQLTPGRLIACECQESEERAVRFETHQDSTVIAHARLVVEGHVLRHCVEVAPKPLYRFAFKNGSRSGEVDQVVHHFAGAPRNIRPACKRPDTPYQVQASLTSTDFH